MVDRQACFRAFTFAASLVAAAALPSRARAADEPLPGASTAHVPDRVAVRFVSPETGGMAHPRFFTERELALFTRFETLIEQVAVEPNDYLERYTRVATDRLVARAMLASLLLNRGTEPPELSKLALDLRAELADRIGGPAVLEATLKHEGIEESELMTFLQDQARATWYVDRVITPILAVTEDSLSEAFRATLHPFRGMKLEDARLRMRRWLATERMRVAELEFLQSARTRIKIVPVLVSGT